MSQPSRETRSKRAVNLVLSDPFVAAHGSAGIDVYVQAIDDVLRTGAHHDDKADVESRLRASFEGAGLVLPPQSYAVIAEQLHGIDPDLVSIATDDGAVVYGRDLPKPADMGSPVSGTGDPEDPDRPAYS